MKTCEVPGLYGDLRSGIELNPSVEDEPYCVFLDAATHHPTPETINSFAPMVEKNSVFCPQVEAVREYINEIRNRKA